MEIFAIIQARMGSTRLACKVMKPLLGKSVLWHVVNRVTRAKSIAGVFIATTTDSNDDVIADFCRENHINVFRGSEDDVLDRYYRCAKENGIEHIARLTADCPLHDPEVVDFVCKEYMAGNYDYASNTFEYTFPDGLDVEVFSFAALEEAWKNAKLPSEREHVTPYIKKNLHFKHKKVSSLRDYPIYRLTIDCPEDYEFINKIYEGIGKEQFTLDETIDFLSRSQELLKINQHYQINEGYLKSLETDKKAKEESA